MKITKDTHYLTPTWPAPSNIRAYTTTRLGGFSQTPFASFNLAYDIGDNAQTVSQNRQKLQDDLQLPNPPVWLKQVHKNNVACLQHTLDSRPIADASITRQSNIVCAVMTADCLPILLCNHVGDEVAAIHAGWRGILAGVIQNTLKQMNSAPQQLMAWLGPAISQSAFAVGPEVYGAFQQADNDFTQAFICKNNQWHASLTQLATQILKKNNVNHIVESGACTYSQPQQFYSYRQQQQKTGRMASLIWINNE